MSAEAIQKLKAQLTAIQAQIKNLKVQVDTASAESQVTLYKAIEDLREKEEAIRNQLDRAKQEGEDAWKEVKQGAGKAWNRFKTTLVKSKKAFQEGMEENRKK